MGARPSSFKGAGFLNNVDGTITGYVFTTSWNGKEEDEETVRATKRKSDTDDFTPLYAVVSVRVDGGNEDVERTFFAGNADDFEIVEEGHTLEPVTEGANISGNSDFGKLITSMCENGFDEEELPEDKLNWESIINQRCRFVQVDVIGRDGKVKTRKNKKDGKTYNIQSPQVTRVYGSVPVVKRGAVKATATTPSATTKKSTNGSGKALTSKQTAEPAVNDIDKEAQTAVLAVVEANGGKLVKSRLRMKLLSALTGKTDNRDEIIKRAYDDQFLNQIPGLAYDQTSKDQLLQLET